MNYIYDVYLNFNRFAYLFYEWKESDKIEHIRKIPIFKIESDKLYEILNYDIKIEDKYLNLVYNQTEKYNFEKIEYSCIFINDYIAVAVKMDKNGKVVGKSRLTPDDENEILRFKGEQEIMKIEYKILNKEPVTFFTRYERKVKNFLSKEINDAYEKKEYSKLKYLYQEFFDKNESSNSKMKKQLLDSMSYNLIDKHMELYSALMILKNKKKV